MIPPNGIHTDSYQRLWVIRGENSESVFDVYNYSGEHLFTVHIKGIDPEETMDMLWWTVSEYGLMAFSVDPLEYPKVFVFDLP